jgi:hypothetical protein
MSVQDPAFIAQDIVAAVWGSEVDCLPPIGDLRDRLLEAGNMDCCAGSDFLALMPSVDAPDPLWGDDRTWLRRVLGF